MGGSTFFLLFFKIYVTVTYTQSNLNVNPFSLKYMVLKKQAPIHKEIGCSQNMMLKQKHFIRNCFIIRKYDFLVMEKTTDNF